MKLSNLSAMVLAMLLAAPGMAFAANTVLSGEFDGSESRTDPLPGNCGYDRQLQYQDTVTFQVSADGDYLVMDAFNYAVGGDITALIYNGAFDPASPMTNLVTIGGIDDYSTVSLVGGVSYHLVVQNWCVNYEGAWAVAFTGPGNVTSSHVRAVPDLTQGLFTSNDPTATSDCGLVPYEAPYHVSEAVQVSTTGTYYYQDVSIESDIDVCLKVYDAPFDPNDPDANRIDTNLGQTNLDDSGSIDLEAGQDYYFVSQPTEYNNELIGEYFYVLAPPAPFRINQALDGAWFNPQTNGQGMFIDTYDNQNLMFVGWYTFDLSRPVDGTAQLGEPGHRWLTAYGPIDGVNASLDVYLAQGGAFDATDPPIGDQTVIGSLEIEFTDCLTATANYALTQPVVSGQIPLQPLAGDHVELCESITNVPGMPGPL